jgi:phosphopantetheinyl transferase/acyl carrier protein
VARPPVAEDAAVPAVVPAPTNGHAPAEVTASRLDAAAISKLLLTIVADRTGYPIEMIDLDLDLEADLGIDSIKRVEILGSLQQQTGVLHEHDMEVLAGRKTLRQVSEFLATRLAAAATVAPAADIPRDAERAPDGDRPAAPAATGPFIGKIVSFAAGRQLVALREVRLEEDRFLRDHILGRDISMLDRDLPGLPVMPLTMSMEMLGEAAAALVPGRRLVGMRDVRAYRWMALDGEKLTVKLVATAKPDTNEVSVQIFEADAAPAAVAPTPLVEGTMVLADAYPEPPVSAPFALTGERPSKWGPQDLYQGVMFHGPAFRGVVSMDRWGEDGAEATLRTLPSTELFRSTRSPALVTDPVLMDQPGQVVGFWMAEHLETGFVVFPFHLEALHLYAEPFMTSRPLKCRARIVLVGEQQVRSDLDVVDEGGRLVARLTGWWDRRFELPPPFLRFLHAPGQAMLGQPWPAPVAALPGAGGFQAHRLGLDDFPEGFFTSHGGVWQRALAHVVLSRKERELWRGLRMPEPRRVEWLLGRVAVKCALRALLETRYGLRLLPADVEILPDPEGRPVASGAWTRDVARVPILSLSHAGGVAVALVGEADAAVGVGVDVERAGRMADDAERVAFTTSEQALLTSLAAGGDDVWPLRLWCAKEAVAKALGLGLVGGPRALVAEHLDAENGTVRMRLSGEMAARLPAVNERTLIAHTSRDSGLVVATSLYTTE